MPTERQYLVSLGLAQNGRGRFSAEAKTALAKAKSNGMVFDKTAAEIAKEERANRPKKEKKPKAVVKPVIRPTGYDPKAVRKWATENGREVNARGKLSNVLIQDYLKENEPSVIIPEQKVEKPAPVVRKAPKAKRVAVRPENVGYTYIRRGPNDRPYISEPLVAVSNCGYCNKGVSFCGCSDGPVAPKYLGGELLLLTRPVK